MIRNLFTIVIELAGLERKEGSPVFTIPSIFKQYKALDRIWFALMPKSEGSLVRIDFRAAPGEKQLTYFQNVLTTQNPQETKELLLSVLRRTLGSQSE